MITARVSIRDNRREWNRLKKAVAEASAKDGNAVDIGLFGEQGSDLVEYASKNEFGDSSIPERSFIRSTFDEQKADITKKVDQAKIDVLLGRIDKDRFLKRLGLFFQRKVVEKIDKSPEWAVPNAPATIALKRSSHPLIDSGRMRQSITYKIVK